MRRLLIRNLQIVGSFACVRRSRIQVRMAASSTRLWLRRSSAGLCLSFLFVLGGTRAILADPEMDAHVREIVTDNLAPVTTAGHPGDVAAAVYVAGHIQFFNFGFADEAERRPVTSDTLFNVA